MTMSFSSVRPMIIWGRDSSNSLPAKFDDRTTSLPYPPVAVSAATAAAVAGPIERWVGSVSEIWTIVRFGLPTTCGAVGAWWIGCGAGATGVTEVIASV